MSVVDRFCVKEMQEIVEESGQKLEKIPRYLNNRNNIGKKLQETVDFVNKVTII